MSVIELEEIRLLKQSEKSMVLLVRERDGEQLFVRKILQDRHEIYESLKNLSNPYLPKIYDVDISDGTTTVLEEYIDGESLGQAARTEKQICAVIKELCTILQFLHDKSIIHRDIKPSNVILAENGHIRLIDFDAARMVKDNIEQDTKLLGTRGYAPPEQYGFAQTDARADIYSLGMTFQQLLGEKAKKLRYKRIIKKCTDLNPKKRYQSAKQVKSALSVYRRSIAAVSIVIAAILAVTLIMRFTQKSQSFEPAADLLFYAPNSEYIIMREDEAEQGKTSAMRVDINGNGNIVDFSIAFNKDEWFVDSIARIGGGTGSSLWLAEVDELLYAIPYQQFQLSDVRCLVQITCVDLDGNGTKEVLVSKGNGKHTLVTEIWQFVDQADKVFKLVGTMWGVDIMNADSLGNITTELNQFLTPNSYRYEQGELYSITETDFTTFKEFQKSEYGETDAREAAEIIARGQWDTK